MATTTPPAIDALPAAPDPNDRSTFNARAYPWSAALPTFSTQISAVATNVKANADDCKTNADVAAAALIDITAEVDAAMTAGLADAATNAATATTQAGLATTNGAAQVALAAAQVALATTQAGNAATSASDAAAAVTSIAGGPVASINGMTGVVTGIADLASAQTFTGTKTFTGYIETVYALSGTVIDPANGTIQTKTLAANTTFTESIADGQSIILGITAGAYSVTWPAGTVWTKVGGSGTAPTLTSTGVNWIVLWQVGGVLRGAFLGTA